MKVYTIQHMEVYKKLLKNGEYKTDKRFICFNDFKEAYCWLNQMGHKLKKNWSGDRPIWLWDKRPDMRNYRFISSPDKPLNNPHVLLTLDIPDEDILWSEFGLWHMVLSQSFVAYNEKEYDAFNKKYEKYDHLPFSEKPKSVQIAIEKSWERILKLDKDSFKHFDKSWVGKISLQGIVPAIYLSQVVKVEKFNLVNKFYKKKK